MPEDLPPNAPVTPPPPSAPSAPQRAKVKETDAGHVPMSEEFDRAKWTLPPVKIVLIGIGIILVAVAIMTYANRAKPVAAGSIMDATAVQLQDNTILAAVQVNLTNSTEKAWYIKEMKATVKTDQGEYSDDAATAEDSKRYFQAFPVLGAGAPDILKYDQKVMPGQQVSGTIVVSFPITKDQFDARKSISVTLQPFDVYPVTITK